MSIITTDKISLAFGHHLLLDQISLGIDKTDKVGLIGRNGSGKSSFLKAIAGVVPLDDGQIHIADGIHIVYVPQEPILNAELTIFEEVLSGLGETKDNLACYYDILDKLNSECSEVLLSELHQIQENLEKNNSWGAKNTIDNVLSELKLNGNDLISSLSGGVRKKVAIAKALVVNPDVLLLDEPTNHLDIYAIEWLEQVINNFNGSVLLITHDRAFLDKTVNKIIELDRGKLGVYPNTYAKYQEIKLRQLQEEAKTNREFDKFLAQEEVWIRKGIEARRTRNEGRVKRLEELRKQRVTRRDRLGNVNLKVDSGNLSGKVVAKLDGVSISFNQDKIINNFTANIMRGDKIGLIGPNGIGKSTLLKIILGQIKPDSGKIELGTRLEIAYFDQMRESLNDESTIADVVSQGQDYVEVNGRRLHIATYLEEFLFEPARFISPVKSLSGGERNRLLLARLFSRPANVLVLDEPTNDLDIETLELLEELLENYTGTVFLVSHDRVFLDNVVTQSFVFTGNGNILELVGGYSDWINYRDTQQAQQNKVTHNVGYKPVKLLENNIFKKENNNRNKLTFKEKQLLETLPLELEALEQEQNQINQSLLDSKLYKNNPTRVIEYQNRLTIIEIELLDKMALWEELELKR